MRYREFRELNRVVSSWWAGLPLPTQFRFKEAFRTLEQVQQPSWDEMKKLEGKCAGLLEIRLRCTIQKVQWRPIGFYGPGKRQFTVVCVARMQGNGFDPPNTCKTAQALRSQVEANANLSVEVSYE